MNINIPGARIGTIHTSGGAGAHREAASSMKARGFTFRDRHWRDADDYRYKCVAEVDGRYAIVAIGD